MQNLTAWALAKAQDIVECEGSALTGCAQHVRISQIETESTLLAVAISDALLEAFSFGVASAEAAQPMVMASRLRMSADRQMRSLPRRPRAAGSHHRTRCNSVSKPME